MKRIWIFILALTVASSGISLATAQSSQRVAKKKGLVSLDFHDVDIHDVVKSIAEITGRNFILDDRVRGRITIISPAPVSVEEAYQAFLSALEVKNLAAVQVGKHTKIVPIRDAKTSPIPVETGMEGPFGDQPVTQLIPLSYISANEIRQALNRLVSRTGSMVAYGPTNSLIITDTASNIRRLMKIIQKLDKQGFQSSVEVIPLRYAQADDVAEKLLRIFEKEKTTTRRRRRSGDVEQGEAVSKIIPDRRTNSLIVMATRQGLGRILDLVAELDRKIQIEVDRGRIHVKYLKHANAEEVAAILSSLLSGASSTPRKTGKKDSQRSTRGFTTAPPLPWEKTSTQKDQNLSQSQAAKTDQQDIVVAGGGKLFESDVRLVADPATNSLIITASPNDYEALEPIINKLDVRRPQVFVEALIMEVNLQKSLDVGLSGHGAGGLKNFGILGVSNFGALSPLAVAGGGNPVQALAGAQGLVLGGLSQSEFEIPGTGITVPLSGTAFNALQNNGVINVLSAPNILTTDNKKAEISVGQTVPFVTADQRDANGQPINSFSREKVGIQLAVTPQINEGDSVTLEIEQKIEEVIPGTGEGTFAAVTKTTSERSAKTTVVAENGQTVAIGGLIKDASKKSVNKVPLLGDVPLLGYLFRKTEVRNEKINLILFLTPHVIHDPMDMTRVSVKKNNERRRFNKTHGIGENKALYDYDLDSGLNMAPPKKASREKKKRRRRYNYDEVDKDESQVPKEDTYVRRSPSRAQKTRTVKNQDLEEEEDYSPRPRQELRRASTSSNPFATIRPPSSN